MSDNSTDNGNQQPRGIEAVKNHMLANKIETALWISRVLSVFFAIGYLLPIFSSSHSAFYKVLISNAATSALRLHQRLPQIQFTKEFLALLLIEDSCHYLFFSLIFLYVQPFILIIVPVLLFAVLHSASYSLKLLDGTSRPYDTVYLLSLFDTSLYITSQPSHPQHVLRNSTRRRVIGEQPEIAAGHLDAFAQGSRPRLPNGTTNASSAAELNDKPVTC